MMAKGKDSQKSVKKAPAKTLKEKRNDKKLKKSQGQEVLMAKTNYSYAKHTRELEKEKKKEEKRKKKEALKNDESSNEGSSNTEK